MKARVILAVALLGLAVIGVPIGPWSFLLAILCLAFGGIATMLSAEAAGKPLLAAAVGFIFFGIAVTAISGGLREVLRQPDIHFGVMVLVAGVVLVGLVALMVKVFGGKVVKSTVPRFPVRQRAAIVEDPVFPGSASPSRGTSGRSEPARRLLSPAPRGVEAASPDDDLGIFHRNGGAS